MTRAVLLLALLLAACSTQQIATDCAYSGAVKTGNTIAGSLIPAPGAGLAAVGLNSAWDAACADPAQTARALSAIEALAVGPLPLP